MLAKERKGIILAGGAGTFLAGASAALIFGDNIFHGAIEPSTRGELEITDLNRAYLRKSPGHA